MQDSFELHDRLQQECLVVGDLPLSRVLLMNDSQYPWLILVPRCNDIREIYQLAQDDRQQLLAESCQLAETMQQMFQPDKLNIAAIGNLVPQLHVHHVARFESDVAWPAPIWGKSSAVPYSEAESQALVSRLRALLRI